MSDPGRLSIRFKVTASVVMFVLVTGAAEIVLRLAGVDTFVENRFFVLNRALDYPEVFDKDRELFWRLRPNQEITSRFFKDQTIRVNSDGLRGKEIAPVKTKTRIMTLGNSCTFGWGLPGKTIFADQLGWRLGSKFEIINGGIPGYSSYQGEKFFASDLAKMQPDLLLIMFGWNDHWAAASEIADRDQQFPPRWIIEIQNRFSRLHIYRLIKKGWLSAVEADLESTFDRANAIYRVSPEDFAVNLTEICKAAKQNGTEPVLMTSPIPSLEKYYAKGMRSSMHQAHEQFNNMTRRVALRQRLLLIDLASEFDKYESLWDDPLNDPIHFNAQGHILAGLIIATELRRSNRLTDLFTKN